MRCLHQEFTKGRVFHIFNHAIDDFMLFYDEEDYNYFLSIFEKKLDNIPAAIFAYCLMPNHYHFLIRQESEKEIYKLFNFAYISYARYYNKRYNRKGHIFRTPLQHINVNSKIYMLQLCKYIHMNPVYANLVDKPEDWTYSNYLEWIKKRKGLLFAEDFQQKYFPDPQRYIEFVTLIKFYSAILYWIKSEISNWFNLMFIDWINQLPIFWVKWINFHWVKWLYLNWVKWINFHWIKPLNLNWVNPPYPDFSKFPLSLSFLILS